MCHKHQKYHKCHKYQKYYKHPLQWSLQIISMGDESCSILSVAISKAWEIITRLRLSLGRPPWSLHSPISYILYSVYSLDWIIIITTTSIKSILKKETYTFSCVYHNKGRSANWTLP